MGDPTVDKVVHITNLLEHGKWDEALQLLPDGIELRSRSRLDISSRPLLMEAVIRALGLTDWCVMSTTDGLCAPLHMPQLSRMGFDFADPTGWSFRDFERDAEPCELCGRTAVCKCINGARRCAACNWSPEVKDYVTSHLEDMKCQRCNMRPLSTADLLGSDLGVEDCGMDSVYRDILLSDQLFHLSFNRLGDVVTFVPRIPESRLKDEDGEIARICCCPTVVHCISAIFGSRLSLAMCHSAGRTYYVYVPEEGTLFCERPVGIPDWERTKERWVLQPTRFFLVGTVYVNMECDTLTTDIFGVCGEYHINDMRDVIYGPSWRHSLWRTDDRL